MLKPKCAHSTYAYHFGVYDVKFGSKKVDTCEDCDRFVSKINSFVNKDSAECIEEKRKHHAHTVQSDKGYKMQTSDYEKCEQFYTKDFDWDRHISFRQFDASEYQVQDAGGNGRKSSSTHSRRCLLSSDT